MDITPSTSKLQPSTLDPDPQDLENPKNLNPEPPKPKKYIVKSRQKSPKNPKFNKKHKNHKSEIKVSKSLANPIQNPNQKQIQSKCKENDRSCKNQHF